VNRSRASESADFWYRRGAQLLADGQLTEAEQAFWSCLAVHGDHASALHLLGRVRACQGQAEAALALQLGSWRRDPSLGWNAFAAAELLERERRWGEAAVAYRAALEALPRETWIADLAGRSEGLGVLGGERLSEGFGAQAYALWCNRFEPPLSDPSSASAPARDRPPDGWLVDCSSDALLRRHALSWLSTWLAHHPDEADLLYGDEDRLDPAGQRRDPWFKPGWVPESFWSTPWLGTASFWRRSWLEDQGLPPPPAAEDADGRWRWQLQALACAPRITHLNRVLAHRRRTSPSGGAAGPASPSPLAGAAALAEHLRASGEGPLQVDPLPLDASEGSPAADLRFRLNWAAPRSLRVSAVVLTRDRPDRLARTLHDVERSRGPLDLEWVVVDNGSRLEATAALLHQWQQRPGGRVQVLPLDQPFNWSLLNNRAASMAGGELLLFLNNDLEVPTSTAPNWLSSMAGQALRSVIGCVGARLLYPNGTLQHCGIVPPLGAGCEHPFRGMALQSAPHRGRLHHLSGWPAVTGACLMVQSSLWWRAGGFDPQLPVEGNDVDFCLRLGNLGFRHVVCPEATLIHHEASSRPTRTSTTWAPAQRLLMRRWPAAMATGGPWWPAAAGLESPDGRPRELAGRGWL
jgi:GT2 family glycosyltransferase